MVDDRQKEIVQLFAGVQHASEALLHATSAPSSMCFWTMPQLLEALHVVELMLRQEEFAYC